MGSNAVSKSDNNRVEGGVGQGEWEELEKQEHMAELKEAHMEKQQ